MATYKINDPDPIYNNLAPLWKKSRAVCGGERKVKAYDKTLDVQKFTNLLVPFSPYMDQGQYDFYKAEAELPGITSQFAKMLVGGLLRKPPSLTLPEDIPSGAMEWILKEFGEDDSTLVAFMNDVLWEEIQTSRAWVHVAYPRISKDERDSLTAAELLEYKPYPVVWPAESVINVKTGISRTGKSELKLVVVSGYKEVFTTNEFHPDIIETMTVHALDEDGFYYVDIYERPVSPGMPSGAGDFEKKESITDITSHDVRLNFIPAWPLSGAIGGQEPILSAIIDKEISLYNKISRRNHLLYGAATYTPIVFSDMGDAEFREIVNKGLGTWLKLGRDDKADILKTPTEALKDMETAIAAGIEEIAKLGVRMLSPEAQQSGIAIEIRNAAQTAQLGSLSSKVSSVMGQIITFMINWRYGLELKNTDVEFTLSDDFNPVPLGADWLRLATEWYEAGLIPRSIWLLLLKQNDMIPNDYDDKQGQLEINGSEMIPSRNDASRLKGPP